MPATAPGVPVANEAHMPVGLGDGNPYPAAVEGLAKCGEFVAAEQPVVEQGTGRGEQRGGRNTEQEPGCAIGRQRARFGGRRAGEDDEEEHDRLDRQPGAVEPVHRDRGPADRPIEREPRIDAQQRALGGSERTIEPERHFVRDRIFKRQEQACRDRDEECCSDHGRPAGGPGRSSTGKAEQGRHGRLMQANRVYVPKRGAGAMPLLQAMAHQSSSSAANAGHGDKPRRRPAAWWRPSLPRHSRRAMPSASGCDDIVTRGGGIGVALVRPGRPARQPEARETGSGASGTTARCG